MRWNAIVWHNNTNDDDGNGGGDDDDDDDDMMTITKSLSAHLSGMRVTACPSPLGHGRDSNDAGKVCLPQDFRLGDLLLPVDVEMVLEASEMEVVKLFVMSSTCSPDCIAVE